MKNILTTIFLLPATVAFSQEHLVEAFYMMCVDENNNYDVVSKGAEKLGYKPIPESILGLTIIDPIFTEEKAWLVSPEDIEGDAAFLQIYKGERDGVYVEGCKLSLRYGSGRVFSTILEEMLDLSPTDEQTSMGSTMKRYAWQGDSLARELVVIYDGGEGAILEAITASR